MSTDRGLSFGLMVNNEIKIAPAQGFIGNPSSAVGNYVLPITVPDGYHSILDTLSTTFNGTIAASGGNSVPLPHTNIVYYKMVGYYTVGLVYESFVVTTSPTAESVTNPNNGHALVKTRVAASWIV